MKKDLVKAEQEVLKARIKAERAILKGIDEQYQEALGAINSHIAQLMGRQDANLPHVIRRVEYQRMLKQQIQAALDKLHAKEYESVTEYLNESYTDAFVGTMYTLHHQDMPVILPIDQDLAVKAITLDTKLKEPLYKEMGKDINKLKGTIQQAITTGIVSGMAYSEIANIISNQAGIPMRRAKTIARTEAGRVQEQASYDAAQQAAAKGAKLVKQWSAIRDGKTRDAHRALHNQTRELNEPFEIDGEEAMYPHDFGQAHLDCNCRCTMLTLAKASLDDDTLKQMEADADFHNLRIKDTEKYGKAQVQNLGDFKQKYLKAAEDGTSIFKHAAEVASSPVEMWMNMTSDEQAAFMAGGFDINEVFNRLHGENANEMVWKPAAPGGAESFHVRTDFPDKIEVKAAKSTRGNGWVASADAAGTININENGLGDDWKHILAHESGHQLVNFSPELQKIVIENPGDILGRFNIKNGYFDGLFGEYNPEEAFATAVSVYYNNPGELAERYPKAFDAIDGLFAASPSARTLIDAVFASYRKVLR